MRASAPTLAGSHSVDDEGHDRLRVIVGNNVHHCFKTDNYASRPRAAFNYQSVCHCSKTGQRSRYHLRLFDYQSVCHCSKTLSLSFSPSHPFDYQSVCHCSKTKGRRAKAGAGLTTSQFVTAPKLMMEVPHIPLSLTTSQFVTAPKPPLLDVLFHAV